MIEHAHELVEPLHERELGAFDRRHLLDGSRRTQRAIVLLLGPLLAAIGRTLDNPLPAAELLGESDVDEGFQVLDHLGRHTLGRARGGPLGYRSGTAVDSWVWGRHTLTPCVIRKSSTSR